MADPRKADYTHYSLILTNNVANEVFRIPIPTNQHRYGNIDYIFEMFDGTLWQVSKGRLSYNIRDTNGVYRKDLRTIFQTYEDGISSFSVAWDMSEENPSIVTLFVTTSLTPVAGFPKIDVIIQPADMDDYLYPTPLGNPLVSTGVILRLTNEEQDNLPIGTVLYASSTLGVKRANALSIFTKDVIGLVYSDPYVVPGDLGEVIISGTLIATTDQWDVITGVPGGLVPGSLYFLDPYKIGKLTALIPYIRGQYAISIGRALSSTVLLVKIAGDILL